MIENEFVIKIKLLANVEMFNLRLKQAQKLNQTSLFVDRQPDSMAA